MVQVQESPVRSAIWLVKLEAGPTGWFSPAVGVPSAAAQAIAAALDVEDDREGALFLEPGTGAAGEGEGTVREAAKG